MSTNVMSRRIPRATPSSLDFDNARLQDRARVDHGAASRGSVALEDDVSATRFSCHTTPDIGVR